MATDAVRGTDVLTQEIAGLDSLDSLDIAHPKQVGRPTRVWSAAWPKLMAAAIVLGAWQGIVWLHLKPEYAFPGPGAAFSELWKIFRTHEFLTAMSTTMRRAAVGFALALAIGTTLGVLVSRSSMVRRAFGSLITGLQSMPSITWFPFAIILFKLSETAILFVVVLGAAPSIANGLVSGIDHIPPLLLRAGHVLGARGVARYRYVVIPAALPGYIAGLKQGWAFAWRSLMAGELLVVIAQTTSIGVMLDNYRTNSVMPGVMAMMITVLAIGIVVDSLVFGTIERRIRARRGLMEPA